MTAEDRQSILENARTYVTHYRQIDGYPGTLETNYDIKAFGVRPSAKGGKTVVNLQLPDGRLFTGEAICSPRDNFCRKTGREIALGRALKKVTA